MLGECECRKGPHSRPRRAAVDIPQGTVRARRRPLAAAAAACARGAYRVLTLIAAAYAVTVSAFRRGRREDLGAGER